MKTKKTNWTPGPWIVESDGSTVTMAGQCVITSPAPDGASRETQKANARLIAAAPALAEALKAVYLACATDAVRRVLGGDYDAAFGKVRAALAQAEGGK